MFPDFRLMIGAIMASIITLGCGFTVFAAFRVNHEPLARFSNISAPVPLVADSAAPRVAPFPGGQARGSRFEMNDGAITGSIASAPLPVKPQDAQRAQIAAADTRSLARAPLTVAPTQPADSIAAVAPRPASGAPSAATIGSRPDQAGAAEPAAVEPRPEPSSGVAAAAPAAIGSPDPARSEPAKVEPAKPEPAKFEAAKSEQRSPETPRAADQERAATQASQEPSQEPREKLTREPNAAIVATAAAPVDDDTVNAAHDSAGRERLVSGVARRGRRTHIAGVAPSNSYNSPFSQSNFQSTPSNSQTLQANASFFGAQPTPPATRRVVRRVAAKPAAVGGPFVAPPVR